MAAAGARFSIREYAARARAGGGSWPFGGEAGALPPMEVRRFRWWAHEAAAVEEEREVERRMAAKRRKRSVAELFASVPRVAGGRGKRSINGMQAKKGKLVLAVEVKASKGFKKKKVPTGIVVSKKEKSGNVKAASISMFQDSMRMRKLTKSVGNDKRNQEASVLPNKKGKRRKNNSFLDSKKNAIKKSVQAQSILHKQSKVGFSTLMDNTDASKLNPSCKPKQVTFSHDIFGWTAPLPENNTEQPQSVQISQRPSQKGHDQGSGDELQLVYQQADAIPGAIEEDASSLSEIAVSTGVFCTFPVAKPKERTIVGNLVDRNQCTEVSNSSNYFNSISLACLSSKMPSQNIDGVDSHLDNDEDFSLDAECLGEENHVIPQGSSNPISLAVKAISGDIFRSLLAQPSSSGLVDRRRSTLPERMAANRHLSKVHHDFVGSGKDLMNSISSSAGSKESSDGRATDCVPACRNKYFSDDYAGLPLNSLGEFVRLPPGGNPSSINISKRQYLRENSSHPSAFPAFYTPTTCTDHVNLNLNHHVPKIYTIDQSPHFTPTAPTEYEMDFRQLPCSKRMETHKYAIQSSKCPCTNQQELSAVCYCSECMGCHNPHWKLHGIQSCFLRQDCEQNTQSTSETTMRLMGKIVTLGTSSIQCRDPNNESPGSCKQTQAEDCSFQGTYRKAFPQLFHWEMGDPPCAFRIPHGDSELSENPSFLPAAELRSELDTNSFRRNGYSQQAELTTANNLYVEPATWCNGVYVGPATWCNEDELQHRQPFMPNQVQSNAKDMLVSVHHRNTQNMASVPSFNRRNSVRNFMEKRPAPYQPGYFAQKFSNMTQMNTISSSLSGYAAVQSTPGLTTQTKFTSLPPLPPSLASSHIRSLDYTQHCGSNTTTFRPSIPAVFGTSRFCAPGDYNVEGSGRMNGNGKRPAEKDYEFLTSPKKPYMAAQKDDLNLLPIPERGLQFCGSRPPGAQHVDTPVGFGPEPRPDLRCGSRDANTTWSYPVSALRPVKLKSGARHDILEPGASGMGQGTVNSVTPFAVENAACAASTSKNRGTEIYKF